MQNPGVIERYREYLPVTEKTRVSASMKAPHRSSLLKI